MAWSADKKERVAEVLRDSLRRKMADRNPEPATMPFHARLLGADRMELFSFIHSLNTNFGTTIYEPIAQVLAKDGFRAVACQQDVGTYITEDAQKVIQDIMNRLSTKKSLPDKKAEIDAIRAVCQKGEPQEVKSAKADIKLVGSDGTLYFIDIKTPKPNKGGTGDLKRTLLQWTAATLLEDPTAKVYPFIAMPYNPYAPEPYKRWTVDRTLDLKGDLKVAEEFWDFLAGEGSYSTLLNIFQEVGIELREEIDAYFRRYTTE